MAYGATPATERACPGSERRAETYQADLYTSNAVDFVRRRAHRAQPLFLSVAYLAPHGGGPNRGPDQRCRSSAKPAPRHRGRFEHLPLPRPPSFNERRVDDKPAFIRRLPRFTPADVSAIATDYRCRRESLLAVDEGVSAIMDQLQRSGELDNTLVVFTSDNGYFQGEHRVKRGKIKVYEPSVRVPALMRGPGVPADKDVRQLTANSDLAATILDATGAKPGRELDGVSLLDVARHPSAFEGRRLLLENGPQDGTGSPRYQAIRTPRYKYVEYETGRRELYDLRYDRFELRSRHRSRRYQRVRKRLARELDQLRGCTGDACRR